jgi:hypothetical protein
MNSIKQFLKSISIPKIIGFILLILAALLPIQNAIVVFAVNVLNFPNWLALWKEVLVLLLITSMAIDLLRNVGWRNLKYKWFLGVFALLNLMVISSSFGLNKVPLYQFILGYRFELFWLWLWVIGFVWIKNISAINVLNQSLLQDRSTLIKNTYKTQLTKGIFLGFGLCLILTLGQLIIGKEFVQFLGYTDSTLDLVAGKINSPICHAIDYGIDTCRLAAPFSSPNHLAGYLICILGFVLFYAVKRGELDSIAKAIRGFKVSTINLVNILHSIIAGATNYSFVPLSIIISILIFWTYSRFALIVLALYWSFVVLYLFQNKFSKALTIIILLFTFTFSILITSIDPTWATKILPTFLAKPSSSIEHYRLTGVSLDILKSEPKILLAGLGQGSSGSSTTYFEPDQNVIYNRFKDISYKWFIKPQRITVPENWYLELILNGGLLYTLLYLFILIYPICNLVKEKQNSKLWWSNSPLEGEGTARFPCDILSEGWQSQTDGVLKSDVTSTKESYLKNQFYQTLFITLAFFGIMLGNIFLHLWENQTIAIYWSLVYLWWNLEEDLCSVQD